MRIGFLALSGIRACDPELMALGLTLPGVLERSKVVAALPSLGLLTLAGMTPAEHERAYFEVTEPKDLGALPTGLDLVAISSLSAQIKDAYRIAERYRAAGVPVVMGGLHVTARPEEPSQHGAAAVVGEGELVWDEVLEDAARGALKPVYDARGRDFHLGRAPMPAFELLDVERYNRFTVQTSRGCPWRCNFCASSILLTKKYKQKPVGKVLAEIDRLRALWPRPFIEFADDNSFVHRAYWYELLPELKKRRVKWFTETDLSVYQDERLLELMREAGCVEVLIGFESPSERALDGVELKRNFKLGRFQEYRTAIRTIQRHGIRVNACFVVGLDGHGPGVVEELLDFVRDTPSFDVQVTVPTAFPGTPLWAQLVREGRLLDEGTYERCTLFDVNFEPRGMSVEALRAAMRRLVVELYSDAATAARRDQFHAIWMREQARRSATRPVAA
jgi:radical SAM superfamily enzyme YgiQ (UPF0313 family)